jgi:hypothetical protein
MLALLKSTVDDAAAAQRAKISELCWALSYLIYRRQRLDERLLGGQA